MNKKSEMYLGSLGRSLGGATRSSLNPWFGLILIVVAALIGGVIFYQSMRIEVPSRHVAILTRRDGKDLTADMELAPDASYKGVQIEPLREGRFFYNPVNWDWSIEKQVEVPEGKVGVVVRLFGDDLPLDRILASEQNQKGIVPGALRPGRYPDFSNPFAYKVEFFSAVTVPAGFKGVQTLVTGAPSKKANQLLVEPGERGTQKAPLDPGTYYVNPYETRISLVDCRTKRLDLASEQDMGFPSRDGFWIRLDGSIQFHVIPERAPYVYVVYNEVNQGDDVFEEIVQKIIVPNARSFCRLSGSSYTGRQFIEGKAREQFQKSFESKLVAECEPKGIKIESVLITKIFPPEPIAAPVRGREIAKQKQAQYKQEIEQQKAEARLVSEKMKIAQRKKLIDAEREVITLKTKAMEEQKVAVTKAEQEAAVAAIRLDATKDQAAAIRFKGKADAQVIRLRNEAEVSGLRASVAAFDNSGALYAQNVLLTKLAPSFRRMMVNTASSPLMKMFERFGQSAPPRPTPPTAPKTVAGPATVQGAQP